MSCLVVCSRVSRVGQARVSHIYIYITINKSIPSFYLDAISMKAGKKLPEPHRSKTHIKNRQTDSVTNRSKCTRYHIMSKRYCYIYIYISIYIYMCVCVLKYGISEIILCTRGYIVHKRLYCAQEAILCTRGYIVHKRLYCAQEIMYKRLYYAQDSIF